MARLSRLLVVLAVLGGASQTPSAWAQAQSPAPPSPPAPAPSSAAEANPLPGLPRPPDAPGSLYQEAPPTPPYACAPLPGPYFERDPRLDPPQLPQPGWFTEVEVGIAVPHIKDRLIDMVQVGSRAPDVVHLPAADLDWTAAPRLEVGYLLPSGFGAFSLAYRFLDSQGSGGVLGPDAPASLQSRLRLQVADCDYTTWEISLWPNWGMKWRFGIRGANIFFDSRSAEPFAAAAAGGGIFALETSNNFWGIGPHYGLELTRKLGDSGLALTLQSDGATLLGRIGQNFSEASTTLGPGGLPVGGATRQSNPQDVPMVNVFVGLGWCPPGRPNTRVYLGYQYEYWWNVGRLSTAFSRGELSDQGILLRADFHF